MKAIGNLHPDGFFLVTCPFQQDPLDLLFTDGCSWQAVYLRAVPTSQYWKPVRRRLTYHPPG